MSIIRAARPQSNFYILDKRISEDRGLTWAARGLLIFLLGKPDNWRISPEHLRKETDTTCKPTGRDGIYSLLAELITSGYVERKASRKDDGTLAGYDYIVYDEPILLGDVENNPFPAQPDTAAPDTAQPFPANPTLTSTHTKEVLRQPRTERKPRAKQTVIPDDFGISERVREWAIKDGYTNLDGHLKAFILKCKAKGYTYVDWDSAFMEAIRKDWAGLNAAKMTYGAKKAYGKQAEWDAAIAGFVGSQGNPDDPYTIDMEYVS